MDNKTTIKKSIQYIEENLNEEISLKVIAKRVHFSEFHFHRLFKSITGSTVMEYVRKKRLEKAAEILSETSEKITDIAYKYQYSSEEAFSRAFKKAYGNSPRDYRNSFKKKYTCSMAA